MSWQQDWTLFYWGWWIAWCPFVGMFIARISRGRTIREFIVGVMGVPCLFIFVWMGIFGNLGIYFQRQGTADMVSVMQQDQGFFRLFYVALEQMPYSTFSILLATVSGIIYFITSSDSASLIIDMLTAGGDPDPPVAQRVFWAIVEGAVAATLLYTGGKHALQALRAASLTAALPFCFAMLVICYGLVVALRRERRGDAIAPP
jgi:choline/glycine/proline betaine transport protein